VKHDHGLPGRLQQFRTSSGLRAMFVLGPDLAQGGEAWPAMRRRGPHLAAGRRRRLAFTFGLQAGVGSPAPSVVLQIHRLKSAPLGGSSRQCLCCGDCSKQAGDGQSLELFEAFRTRWPAT